MSHLSSFLYIDAEEAMGTPFQALSTIDYTVNMNGASMTSLKDTQQVIDNGQFVGWG